VHRRIAPPLRTTTGSTTTAPRWLGIGARSRDNIPPVGRPGPRESVKGTSSQQKRPRFFGGGWCKSIKKTSFGFLAALGEKRSCRRWKFLLVACCRPDVIYFRADALVISSLSVAQTCAPRQSQVGATWARVLRRRCWRWRRQQGWVPPPPSSLLLLLAAATAWPTRCWRPSHSRSADDAARSSSSSSPSSASTSRPTSVAVLVLLLLLLLHLLQLVLLPLGRPSRRLPTSTRWQGPEWSGRRCCQVVVRASASSNESSAPPDRLTAARAHLLLRVRLQAKRRQHGVGVAANQAAAASRQTLVTSSPSEAATWSSPKGWWGRRSRGLRCCCCSCRGGR